MCIRSLSTTKKMSSTNSWELFLAEATPNFDNVNGLEKFANEIYKVAGTEISKHSRDYNFSIRLL